MSIADRMKKRNNNEKKRKLSLTIGLVAAGIVIVGTAAVLLMTLNTKKIDEGVYFYDTGVRFDKQGAVIKNDEEKGAYLERAQDGQTEKLTLSVPLYYADKPRIFLPVDSTITLPSERKTAKIAKFTEFEDEQGLVAAVIGNDEIQLNEGFLYDGKSTYVFLDDMTVSWNGKALKMPPLSYAIVVYNQRIELYPYGGEPVVEQTGQISITASADKGYTIDLGSCILTNAQGFESLLISEPSLMEPFTG